MISGSCLSEGRYPTAHVLLHEKKSRVVVQWDAGTDPISLFKHKTRGQKRSNRTTWETLAIKSVTWPAGATWWLTKSP